MKKILQQALREAFQSLCREGAFLISQEQREGLIFEVTVPKDDSYGDYTSSVALSLAGRLKQSPLDIARTLKEKLSQNERLSQFSVEVVMPGYINFSLTPEALSDMVADICKQGRVYGSCADDKQRKILLEFVSANPTGPLHMGNTRGGFFGETLARVLRKYGANIATEYYVNDAGEQVDKLGHSVLRDADAVYAGDYIDRLAERLSREGEGFHGTDPRSVGEWAGRIILEEYIKPTLREKMGIAFDVFISERDDIIRSGFVDKAISLLAEKGLTYEESGALWLRTTQYGDDKDRVLVKANGVKTYFASDCGYLLHKRERGFEEIYEVWGADHHGYVARFRAAAEALGFSRDQVKFTLVQMVRLVKDGKEVRMSKRAGNVVTVDELLGRIDAEVVRFFFLMYSPDTHMNFDMGLAEEQSKKNPVFYVQYAHARMASIFRKAEEDLDLDSSQYSAKESGTHLRNSKEILLARHLAKFPDMLCLIAETSAVHQLPQYAIRLADIFHSFYGECTVIDAEDMNTTRLRLALVGATKNVLAETLRLIGVSAPEKM